jgi:hypothetical protein
MAIRDAETVPWRAQERGGLPSAGSLRAGRFCSASFSSARAAAGSGRKISAIFEISGKTVGGWRVNEEKIHSFLWGRT